MVATAPGPRPETAAEIFPKAARGGELPTAVGGVRIDWATRTVHAADGTSSTLRPKTAALLAALAGRPGTVISKDELLATVWPGLFVDEDGLVQCAGEIRRALGPDRAAIRTFARQGYALMLPAAAPADWPSSASVSTTAPAGTGWRRGLRRQLPLAAVALVGLAIALLGATVLLGERDPADPISTSSVAFDGPAVAVLPLVVLGGEERWERLGRALTEDVIADLAQNAWLFVFADATTRSLRVADVASARSLGAAYAVTGSLQVDTGVARITFALLDTITGRHLWGAVFEGTVAGIPALQRTASEAVVGQLAANWSGPIARAERARAMGRGTDDLAAYELYLRASEAMQSYASEALIEAEALLQRAVALELGFGEAWAKLASLSYSLVTPQMTAAEMEAL